MWNILKYAYWKKHDHKLFSATRPKQSGSITLYGEIIVIVSQSTSALQQYWTNVQNMNDRPVKSVWKALKCKSLLRRQHLVDSSQGHI